MCFTWSNGYLLNQSSSLALAFLDLDEWFTLGEILILTVGSLNCWVSKSNLGQLAWSPVRFVHSFLRTPLYWSTSVIGPHGLEPCLGLKQIAVCSKQWRDLVRSLNHKEKYFRRHQKKTALHESSSDPDNCISRTARGMMSHLVNSIDLLCALISILAFFFFFFKLKGLKYKLLSSVNWNRLREGPCKFRHTENTFC